MVLPVYLIPAVPGCDEYVFRPGIRLKQMKMSMTTTKVSKILLPVHVLLHLAFILSAKR